MSTIRTSRVGSLWIAIAVLGAAAIAGCGSAGASGGTGTNATTAIPFAQCMRANGVPNFPDPDAKGEIQFPISSPIPQSPAFQRAQDGPCKKYVGR
jgi:hypothetical protein